MIIHAGFGEGAFWGYVAVDAALGLFVPGDVEGAELGKEEQATVW